VRRRRGVPPARAHSERTVRPGLLVDHRGQHDPTRPDASHRPAPSGIGSTSRAGRSWVPRLAWREPWSKS